MKTLPEVAAAWRLDQTMAQPVRYLRRQIIAGRFRARKVGRDWMMTDADISANLEVLANRPQQSAMPDADAERPVAVIPSVASMRRRRSA